MQEAIILVGNSGSGKSTFAKNFVAAHKNFVRINKDSIRKCLVCTNSSSGYWNREDIDDLELIVLETIGSLVISSWLKGKSIVIDSTNIKVKDLEYMLSSVEGKFHYTFRIFEVDVETARARVMERDKLADIKETYYLGHYEENFQNMFKYLQANYAGRLTFDKNNVK